MDVPRMPTRPTDHLPARSLVRCTRISAAEAGAGAIRGRAGRGFFARDRHCVDGRDHVVLHFTTGPVALIGFAMGGRAALDAWRQAPARIERLCLMDAAAPQSPMSRRRPVCSRNLPTGRVSRTWPKPWLPPMLHIDRETDPLLIEPLTAMVCEADAAQHDRQIGALLNRPDARRCCRRSLARPW